MERIKIVINKNTLSFANNKQITGEIYLQVNEASFPEIGWNDFIIIILSWWGESLLNLLSGKTVEATFNFMDGPFFYKILKKNNTDIEFKFYQRGLKTKLMFAAHIDLFEIKLSLIKVIEEVLIFCKQQSWDTVEIYQLADIYSRFE